MSAIHGFMNVGEKGKEGALKGGKKNKIEGATIAYKRKKKGGGGEISASKGRNGVESTCNLPQGKRGRTHFYSVEVVGSRNRQCIEKRKKFPFLGGGGGR